MVELCRMTHSPECHTDGQQNSRHPCLSPRYRNKIDRLLHLIEAMRTDQRQAAPVLCQGKHLHNVGSRIETILDGRQMADGQNPGAPTSRPDERLSSAHHRIYIRCQRCCGHVKRFPLEMTELTWRYLRFTRPGK